MLELNVDGDVLRVWFSYSPFVPSEHGIKMTTPLEVCIEDKKRATLRFFAAGRNEMSRDSSAVRCQV
jgi:hypothetical protein